MNRRRAGRRQDRPSAEGDETLALYVAPCRDTFIVYEPNLYNTKTFKGHSKSTNTYAFIAYQPHLSTPPPWKACGGARRRSSVCPSSTRTHMHSQTRTHVHEHSYCESSAGTTFLSRQAWRSGMLASCPLIVCEKNM